MAQHYFLNDLPNNIKSIVYLFADDTLLSKNIRSTADCETLNNDLKSLQKWEDDWLMSFNVSKCNILTITNKRKPILFDYQLHDQSLKRVKSAKYLGVELTENMKWDKHIANISSKANKTSSFVHRNLKGCAVETQVKCFKSLARPILEYASIVWDPFLKKDIDMLERVQKRAARRITNDYSQHSSATSITRNIGLEKLENRRKRNKAIMFHRIYQQKACIKMPDNIATKNRNTRGHMNRVIQPQARTNVYQHSFFPSASKLWNTLPNIIAETQSETTFKSLINTYL